MDTLGSGPKSRTGRASASSPLEFEAANAKLRGVSAQGSRPGTPTTHAQPIKQLSGAGYLFDEVPTLLPVKGFTTASRTCYSSHHDRSVFKNLDTEPKGRYNPDSADERGEQSKRIFKPLEDYLISRFASLDGLNSSFFPPRRPSLPDRTNGESLKRRPAVSLKRDVPRAEPPVCDLDAKLLLLGDFAENGSWWSGGGGLQDEQLTRNSSYRGQERQPNVSAKSPYVDWAETAEWYSIIVNVAQSWKQIYDDMRSDGTLSSSSDDLLLPEIELQLLQAQEHVQGVLLKATEMLLKRPGRPIQSPEDLRFTLILLENPLLHPAPLLFRGFIQSQHFVSRKFHQPNYTISMSQPPSGSIGGQHSGILRRIFGLISNSSPDCQSHLIPWFSRLHISQFTRLKELVANFLTYRVVQNSAKKQEIKVDVTAGLIPTLSIDGSPASLQAALAAPGSSSKQVMARPQNSSLENDWQIKAAASVMALLFSANNSEHHRRGEGAALSVLVDSSQRDRICAHGQILPTSDFYNSVLDFADLVADFASWESRRGKFSFCQYPFLLSIWAKTQILEFEARRQMQTMARDAFFDSIMTRKNINQYLLLDVRRDCLVEDSLTAVSEIIGSGSEDIKKGLRIAFKGEEGVDAGGLRKEWFLLLVRELFNPDHGMFIYDEDSRYCYFNANSFETSDQYFLVGVVTGLAIYNSTILDVALPPFAFRKLLGAALTPVAGSPAHPRPIMTYSLEDLGEYRPTLARSLRTLLEFEGDVESAMSLDFTINIEKYGVVSEIPLCPGGAARPVTNANRREYVDLYVRYLLDASVTRQFEPFKRGFYTVCGGAALSLFRPEEIELLIRGSDEALEVASLRAVAQYENWGSLQPDGSEPTVDWFWHSFQNATAKNQRKLLSFITGSDRIPATGASLLPIKISCLGDDCGRYPIARTCFNTLALWRYSSFQKFEMMLWTAVHGSEGFGLR